MRARLPISASRFSSPLAPAETPITAIRPPVASACRFSARFGAPTSSRITSNGPCSAKPSGAIASAPSAATCSRSSRVRTVAVTRAPAARASWIAAVPTPPAPPCTSRCSPRAQLGLGEERVVRGREDLRQPAGRGPVERVRAPASAGARAPSQARPARRRRRSPSRARPPRSARRPAVRAQRPRRRAPCRGCPAASRAAPGTGPRRCIMSAPFKPAAWTRTSTSPRPRHRVGVLLDHDLLLADGGGAHRRKPTPARAGRRTRCGASAGTCRRGAPCAAPTRPRPVRRRWGRAWWGCRRRRRCAWARRR